MPDAELDAAPCEHDTLGCGWREPHFAHTKSGDGRPCCGWPPQCSPAEKDACVCDPEGPCLGVPGESDACDACLVLDPEAPCLHDPEVDYDDEDEPCGCSVPHPRWCAWNGACCDHCSHDTTHEARVLPPGGSDA